MKGIPRKPPSRWTQLFCRFPRVSSCLRLNKRSGLPVLAHCWNSLARPIMIKLKINGQEQNWDGDPDLPLLWFLRDEAGLTGTKYGCGQALCGACTIIVD